MTERGFKAGRLLADRRKQEVNEDARLAPFASRAADSQGRLHPEPRHAYRTEFQRDRDRVLHSRAFRRLEHKTQVFVDQERDHYRNRLTHSLEGAQIARTVSRVLGLNEDLAEAIALAHDLGHPPFGHAGERVLALLMKADGGFDHNRQSLRVVDLLEERYPGLSGLNLVLETREGILKHGCAWEHPVAVPPLAAQRSLESQAANTSDEIAYLHHDLEDGLRARILQEDGLADQPLWQRALASAAPQLENERGISSSVRRSQILLALIDLLVTDLLETSAAKLEEAKVASVAEARAWHEPLVGLSAGLAGEVLVLKRFLLEEFYRHPRVVRMSQKAEWIVSGLYTFYRKDLGVLPGWVRARADVEGEARASADYVAGMTDRFAISEHARLVDPHGSR